MRLVTEEPCPGITPSFLPELEKLTLCSEDLSDDLMQPDTLKLDVLSSLICPKLREVVITHTDSTISEENTYDFDTGGWAKIDEFLVRLAERMNSRLEVQLRFLETHQHDMMTIDGFLPSFRKVGDFVTMVVPEAERHFRPLR